MRFQQWKNIYSFGSRWLNAWLRGAEHAFQPTFQKIHLIRNANSLQIGNKYLAMNILK